MRFKQLLPNLLLVVLSILLMIALVEGGTRLFLVRQPQPDRFRLSPMLGWEWTPGYDQVEHFKGVDYQMTISQQGLRNEWVAIPKPDGVFRIIALGDSITEGPGVELSDTFVKQLERLLQGVGKRPIEVINAGTGDYGTEQELIWWRERGLNYQPDLLILNFYLNDSRSFLPPSPQVSGLNNFFAQQSAFYTFYRNLLRSQMANQDIAQTDFRFRFLPRWEAKEWLTNSAELTQLIQEADEDWGLAWYDQELIRVEGLLAQMEQIAREHNVQFLLVIWPVNVQVYTQVDTPLDLTGPQYELMNFARAQGWPVVNLLPVFQSHNHVELYYDQAHVNLEGHRLAAEAIWQALQENEMIP